MRKELKNVLVLVFVGFAFLLLPFAFVHAHPGGLDKDGCHTVSKTYEYVGVGGKILKAGTRHCHRGIGKMKMDGKEILEDPPQKQEEKAKK